MKKKILLIAILLFSLNIASGEEIDGKSLLIKGKNEFDAGRYAEAVKSLQAAYEKLSVVGDYILFWTAKAYRELGNLAESNSRIKELLKSYPESPLKKSARSIQIRNIIASSDITQDLHVIDSYIRDYPEDNEMKFSYAQLLKKSGQAERARAIFKNIYISSNGILSKAAFNELTPSDISTHDLIEKATNLINVMEYKEAESILKIALVRDDGKHKTEILKKLGYALFRQKRYKESAEMYEKSGDHYSRAKALYRAGDRSAFELVLKELSSTEDRRVGSLLIMAATDRRRNGETDEALRIYNSVKTDYPSDAEDSLWGIAWLYYRKGDYQKAVDALTALYNAYGSSKYLYWKARSLEDMGKDASPVYKELSGKRQDFYSLLAQLKKRPEQTAVAETTLLTPITRTDPKPKPFQSERIDILMELGMKKDAALELSSIARKASSADELVSISVRLQEAEEYTLAINVLSRLPYHEAPHSILYPLAYWPAVKEASARHNITPLIILSVMREESRFNPEARSQAGALGLMQLMPQTAYAIDKNISMKITSQAQIYDIKTNINLGAYYLSSLIKEFKSLPAAIAAYNAGEEMVRKWKASGNYMSDDEFIEDIPYDETRNFVKRVLTTYFEYLKTSDEKDLDDTLCKAIAFTQGNKSK